MSKKKNILPFPLNITFGNIEFITTTTTTTTETPTTQQETTTTTQQETPTTQQETTTTTTETPVTNIITIPDISIYNPDNQRWELDQELRVILSYQLLINTNYTLFIPSGRTLQIDGRFNNNGIVNNSGIFTNNGTINNDVTITNKGTINNNKTINSTNTGYIINVKGTINNDNDGTIYNNGSFDNDGTINIININNEIITDSSGTLTNNYIINNNGRITSIGAVINNSEGSINNINGGFFNSVFTTNNGSITNSTGSIFENTGTMNNNRTISNSAGATIKNIIPGIFNNNATLVNDGIIRNTGSFNITPYPSDIFPQIPDPPTNIEVIPYNQFSTLLLTNSPDGGSKITNYQYNITDGIFSFSGITSNNNNPFIINGIANSITYTINVQAINKIGTSFVSETSNYFTQYDPKNSAPSNLTATINSSSTELTISFTKAVDTNGNILPNYDYSVNDNSRIDVIYNTNSNVISFSIENISLYSQPYNIKINNITDNNTIVSSAFISVGIISTNTNINSNSEVLSSADYIICDGLTSSNINTLTNVKGISFNNFLESTSVYSNSIQGNSTIESVVIPPTVTVIAPDTFKDCSSLKSIILPENLQTIESNVFENCTSLQTITIPASVTNIGSGAFKGSGLKYLTFLSPTIPIPTPNYVKPMSMSLYNAEPFSDLVIPEETLNISNEAYENNNEITALFLPDRLISIGTRTFQGCSGILNPLTIPSNVTSIGASAFQDCSGIPSVTLPTNPSFTIIEPSTFQNCSGLINLLTIPSNVISIGDSAFQGCSRIPSVTLLMDSPDATFGSNIFDGCTGITEIQISYFVLPTTRFSSLTMDVETNIITKSNYNELYEETLDLLGIKSTQPNYDTITITIEDLPKPTTTTTTTTAPTTEPSTTQQETITTDEPPPPPPPPQETTTTTTEVSTTQQETTTEVSTTQQETTTEVSTTQQETTTQAPTTTTEATTTTTAPPINFQLLIEELLLIILFILLFILSTTQPCELGIIHYLPTVTSELPTFINDLATITTDLPILINDLHLLINSPNIVTDMLSYFNF